MGLFGNIFGGNKNGDAADGNDNKKKIPWMPLREVDQLPEIKAKSDSRPQIIFKHSTTCGISRMVLNMFKKNLEIVGDRADLYFLDLHQNRNVSNQVASEFNVLHQSPQLLIIKNGEAVADASHGAITNVDLEAFFD